MGISKLLSEAGTENFIFYSTRSDGEKVGIAFSNKISLKLAALRSRILGNYGFNSKRAAKRMISALEHIKPDIVHLHNIHGHDCDLQTLFSYFKEKRTKLIWTLHDCWAFTGYCPHFDMIHCEKWKLRCTDCPQKKEHTWFFDRSGEMYERKKELFAGLDLTIVTPSKWLAELVTESFLKD